MKVHFREVDPFNFWLWLRFVDNPSQAEKNYVDGIIDSWYVLGRLGGFNSENLQAHDQGADLSWMVYDNENMDNIMPALMHNVGQVEYKDNWARIWLDLGTSDSISLDILINAFAQIDSDFVEISELFIGGINEEWDVA